MLGKRSYIFDVWLFWKWWIVVGWNVGKNVGCKKFLVGYDDGVLIGIFYIWFLYLFWILIGYEYLFGVVGCVWVCFGDFVIGV